MLLLGTPALWLAIVYLRYISYLSATKAIVLAYMHFMLEIFLEFTDILLLRYYFRKFIYFELCMHMFCLLQVIEPVVHRDFVYNQFEPTPQSNFFTLSSYVTRELYSRLEKIVNKYKVSGSLFCYVFYSTSSVLLQYLSIRACSCMQNYSNFQPVD